MCCEICKGNNILYLVFNGIQYDFSGEYCSNQNKNKRYEANGYTLVWLLILYVIKVYNVVELSDVVNCNSLPIIRSEMPTQCIVHHKDGREVYDIS